MAAPIAVGTIDQAMLAMLKVRHSWLRAWCLTRQLLVVDEVHASDPYMSEVVARLVDEHLLLGGYVLLMSATLGETMRARLDGNRRRVDINSAIARQYPLVSTNGTEVQVSAGSSRTTEIIIEDAGTAARRAVGAASGHEAILWIRSTVADALEDYRRFQAAGCACLLHHSRYADIDRRYLDAQVLGIIGLNGQRRGIIIVATQTCEQSLDIDADLLATDAVPADVLLQRLGRLHRHRSGTSPLAVVLDPHDWEQYLSEKGRRVGAQGSGWAWVYSPLAVRETVAWLRQKGRVTVPEDVRELVELATHADHLEARARYYGQRWQRFWQSSFGKDLADRVTAQANLVNRDAEYSQALISERAPTRLGDPNVDVEVSGRLASPFTSELIKALPVPFRFIPNVVPGTPAIVTGMNQAGQTKLNIGGVDLVYSAEGLHRL
jgi:CRISPR-associated endonuclease/helicase Cas3